jgi:zinc protease
MWVKTGSADEKKGEEGISHFIEHLVFKGTEKYGVGEIASNVEASGGELNAYTSFDQTVFYVTISKEFVGVGLDVISQMMGFPKFDSKEIDNEREVVLEEIKRGNDSPSRQASRLLFSTAYKTHPYNLPVIGFDKVIKKVTRKTLVNYYTSRYVPRNMHLVIAGDFKMAEMSQQVKEAFGIFNDFKVRKVVRKKEAKQTKARLKVQKAKFEETQFHLAFKVPGAAHKDTAALDVLALVLGQGDSSRLSLKLRMENPLMNSIGASTFTPKETGIFTISGSMNPEQIKPGFEILAQELERILREPPHAEELKKAVTNFEADEFYGMETVDAIARKAGSLENLMGDHKYFEKYLKQVSALQPADIQRVARKYMTPETLNLVMMTNANSVEATKFLKKWISGYSKAFNSIKKIKMATAKKAKMKRVQWNLESKAASRTPQVQRHILGSGATVIFRPSSETPIFSVRAGFLGGLRIEEENNLGVTDLLSRAWTSGTKQFTEAQISERMEHMAGSLSAFGGRNSVGLSMQTIAPFEAEALDMFEAVLTEPVMVDSAIEREKVLMLEGLRLKQDSPGQLVSQLFMEKLFAGHPYHKDMYGTQETITSLTPKTVNQHLKQMAHAKNLTVVVAGSVNQRKWLERLEKATQKLGSGGKILNEFQHRGPQQEQVLFKKLQKEQTHIILGYKGLTLTDPRRYTLQVIQSVLAGQGGRLFLELRDKASLAYSVSPMRMEGIDTGYFGGYIGCSPNKADKAISMLKEEFKKMADHKVGDVELSRAKRYLIGRHDIDLQRNAAIGSAILFNDLYGVELDEPFRFAENLKNISAADVQTLAQEIFSQKAIVAVVGAEEPGQAGS